MATNPEEVTTKQEITFFGICFLGLLVVLFHYAYIMRQLLWRPEISRIEVYLLFAGLVGTVMVILLVLTKFVYPYVYRDSVTETKKNE